MFNSLSQTLLKITSPGVPDFYQGTEIWDFSLVDPDNRRPVDYSIRKALLQELKRKMEGNGPELSGFHKELLRNWEDGSIKLYVTYKALNYRQVHRELFLEGGYQPLASEGELREHVCAFMRYREGKGILVIVPRFLTRLVKAGEEPLGEEVWKDSWMMIPEEISGEQFRNVFTDEMIGMKLQNGRRRIALAEVFKNFPVAMLEIKEESE
jgi:(1->4)-alpha-D-glucan 1-alpha-D-glucosylmutase